MKSTPQLYRFTLWFVVSVLSLVAGLVLGGDDDARAQQPPPTIRVLQTASTSITDTPRQYDLVQFLVELAPGAAVPSHRVNGRAIITVISGEVTRVEENGKTEVFRAGQTYPEDSGDEFDVDINNGKASAQFLATFLLQPGAEPLLFNPHAAASSAGAPKFLATGRTTVGTTPANFTLSHSMAEVAPGFSFPLHTHDGWHLLTHVSGSVENRVNGKLQGGQFVHGPHDVHQVANTSNATATYVSASINPVGVPPARLVPSSTAATAPVAAPPIRPPATGDGGLATAG